MADEDFLSGAVLDTIVPHASDVDLEKVLGSSIQDGSVDSSGLLSAIEQRSLLFFDELVTVYIALRLTNSSETALTSQLPRLSLKLEAFAVDSEGPPEETDDNPQPTKDLLYSGVVWETDDPIVIVNEADDEEEVENYVYVLWKSEAFLNRPRVRFQQPSILFAASATLNPPRAPQESLQDDYLPSLVPGSANVFQSLTSEEQDSSHDGPYLPASRLLRMVPASKGGGGVSNIQQQTCNPFRVIPIASARMRYSRISTHSSTPSTIASLDFEVTPFTSFEVTLQEANLSLSSGIVENLTQDTGFAPPLTCQPRDDITLVYKLTPEDGVEPSSSAMSNASTLFIYLGLNILVSEDCRPRVIMQWKTNVDLPVPLSPGQRQSLQPQSRPTSQAASTSRGTSAPPSVGPAASPQSRSLTDFGVTVSFSGPPQVEVGKAFNWDVFVVNRSDKARKFAMAPIPRRKRTESKTHKTRPSSSSVSSGKGGDIAEAVADENIVYAMQKSAAVHEAQLLSLSTDIRVGPLAPGTCHWTELKLLPLSPGTLQLDAVRLVDLATNDSIDIRSLPDVVASHKECSHHV